MYAHIVAMEGCSSLLGGELRDVESFEGGKGRSLGAGL